MTDGNPASTASGESSIFDDFDALAAVSRLPRTDLDHQRHLYTTLFRSRHADRKPGDLLGHRGRESLHARDDCFQVIRVRDLQDNLGVALAEDVLVDLRRALRDDDEAETELPAFRGQRPEDLGGSDLADLRTEIVRLLDDEHHRRDPSDLSQLEHRRCQAVHDEFLDVRRYAFQVDDRRLALDDELVDPRAFLRENLDLAQVFQLVDERGVLRIFFALQDTDDVSDRVVFRRLAQEIERFP